MPNGEMSVTEAQLRAIAREAGQEGAKMVLVDHWRIMGWDINNPQDVKDLQRFFSWGRQHRAISTTIGRWLTRSFIASIAAGVLAIFILGLREWIGHLPPGGGTGPFN